MRNAYFEIQPCPLCEQVQKYVTVANPGLYDTKYESDHLDLRVYIVSHVYSLHLNPNPCIT
jgi:hypothetical protein